MESLEEKRGRTRRIFETLDPVYHRNKTALKHDNPFQLLIATILSAQCTDKQVNAVTQALFQKYTSPEDYLEVDSNELERDIHSTGFFKNKSRAIKGCCERLLQVHNGLVPSTMEELLKLPGVGRKTANCVLGAAFGVPGVVVDTHVKRLAARLGLTESANPDRIERDIEALLPEEHWRRFSDILIYHGREICKARKPLHEQCALLDLCPSNSI